MTSISKGENCPLWNDIIDFLITMRIDLKILLLYTKHSLFINTSTNKYLESHSESKLFTK